MSRLEDACALELAKLERVLTNIAQAVADGRISPHDGDEREARAEQGTANRIAYLRGEPRPKQRKRQPLDDPDAGRV